MRSVSLRWLRRWQVGLHVLLVLAAVWIGLFVSRRAWFLIPFLPLCFAPFSYARLRLHRLLEQVLDRRRLGSIVLGAFFAAGVLLDAIMLGQLLTARAPQAGGLLHGDLFSWVGPVWFSAHALLVWGILMLGIGRAATRLFGWLVRLFVGSAGEAATEGVSLERRRFLQQAGFVGAGAPFLVSFSGVSLSYDFRVEEREIVLPRWPRRLDGLRVVHLSDIHVGGTMNRRRLLEVAELTNRARPQLVLHTGDFLTHRSGDFDAPLYEALGRIRAPLGQWACLGNHDFDAPGRLVRGLQEAGAVTLRNRLATVPVAGETLELGGVDFQFNALAGDAYARIVSAWPRPQGVARLLLVHDPRAFATLPGACADLVLSGHTHGGHIGVQLGADRAITVVGLAGIPDQGIFRRGDMALFVTRCVGFYGYPMRLGIPPEIAVLTLRSGHDAESA
jgi:predicted MPP superfamily phosphohydrolase